MERLEESTWFEIFRTGVWHGVEYKKDDLDKVVENFEKGDPRVPLIIGHNGFWSGEEKPAHGWVKALKRSGKRLLAKARNVSAELVEAVNDEIYPMRSVELWMDYQGRGLSLGAIAFLGGSNPEVGGMADFKFSRTEDDEHGYMLQSQDGDRVCFAYGSTERMVAASGQNTKTDHQKGGDDNMTKEEIEKAIADGVRAGIETFKAGPEFSGLVAENEQLRGQLTDVTQHAAAVAVQADTRECLAFAKGLLDKKKITPAQHAGLGGYLASLDNREEFEFTAGKKQTRRSYAMELLSNGQAPAAKLFTGIDSDPARAGECENTNAEVEAFAARHGLDPKIVQQNFAAMRGFGRAAVADAESDTAGGVSLLG